MMYSQGRGKNKKISIRSSYSAKVNNNDKICDIQSPKERQ
jgi:hypothetical protein